MKIHKLPQGSPEWHAHRAQHFNASEAAAMLGCSPHQTRSDLLREKHFGLRAENDSAFKQRILDSGHEFEALARPLAEALMGGEDLYPLVGSEEVDGLPLSASLDGLTIAHEAAFEHKRLNEELRQALPLELNEDGRVLPKHFRVQMEQQLLVSGAERVLFMASDWKPDESGSHTLVDKRSVWYYPDPVLRAEIIAGWKQFRDDLLCYTPPARVEVVTAEPVESLPAVLVNMRGALTIESNLDKVDAALTAFIERIPKKPSTDQEFANVDAACKALKKAEEALATEEARALASIGDVEQMRQVVARLCNLARDTRLASEKLVTRRKAEIKAEEVTRITGKLAEYVAALNQRIGKPYMPALDPQFTDWAGAISGLKKFDSMRDKLETKLAAAKIEASRIADRIQNNLTYLAKHAEYIVLFPDEKTMVLKEQDDFAALVDNRIQQHKDKLAEQARKAREAEEAAAEQRRQREAAQAAAAAPAPTAPPVYSPPVEAFVPVTTVPTGNVRPLPTRAPTAHPTLTLGHINERLHPLAVTAAGLEFLGFPCTVERSAKLFHEQDFPRMCDAIVAHIARVRDQRQAA